MGRENNKQLTIDDIKKIIADIEEEEKKESGFNAKIKTLTTVEYYKESFKNKNFTLVKKIKNLSLPLTSSAFYSYKDSSIVIFMDSYTKILDQNSDLFRIVFTCYHEIGHNLQDSLPIYSFNRFACDIDSFIACFNTTVYDKKHDSFYNEIDANNYAIKKTKEYLKRNFPDIYNDKVVQHKFEIHEEDYFTDYVLFDLVNSIEETSYLLKKHKLSIEEKDDISPIINIFFGEDNSFRAFNEILSNKNLKDIDTRVFCAFLSSKAFLNSLDLTNLNCNELEILYKSLKYMNTLYDRQYKIIELEKSNYKERIQSYFKIQKNIFQRISYLKNILCVINDFKKRQAKSYRAHKLHKKKLPEYLDRTSSLLNSKKNNGFVVIDILYIISLVVSLGVIGYLILF